MDKLKKNYDIVLFDLDGTLSASAEGIRYSIEKTIQKAGCKGFDTNDYTLYIGPPLLDTFKNHCNLVGEKAAEAAEAVEIYREIYDTEGKFINKTFDGTAEMLRTVKSAGIKTAVATSKYEKFAEEIVEFLGLSPYIDTVCGSLADGTRKDKKVIIPYALNKLGATQSDRVLMVGDTYFDTKGAMICGIDFLGVTYGYGDRQMMIDEGAENFADTPFDVAEFIIGK